MKPSTFSLRLLTGAACTLGLALLAGCGSGSAPATTTPTPPTNPTPPTSGSSQCKSTTTRPSTPAGTANYAGNKIAGKVMAGPKPIVGAAVQLYSAGAAGNGSAPTGLLTNAVLTDATGAFSIPASYTCPLSNSVLYVVARGGAVGIAGLSNSATVLMAPFGPCNSITSSTAVVVNEATTVAGAFALSQFMTAGAKVGANSTNLRGLTLASATAANLVNVSTGVAPGASFPAATGTAPSSRINSLANLLNACITAAGATACSQLYSLTTVSGTAPSNTLDAVLNIAQHPGMNVASLFTQSQVSSAYSPALSAAPADWTMFATYTGGGMNDPSALAIDSAGNIWVANYFYAASLFSNTGTPIYPAGITGSNLYNSYGLAVDNADTAWITNQQSPYSINAGLGSMTLLNNSTGTLSANVYSSGGLNFPTAVAIDTAATAWIVDYGNSRMSLLDKSGNSLAGASGYSSSEFAFPVAVAVDSKCYAFVGNQASNKVTRVPSDGTSFTSYTVGSGPSGVAVDASDNVWTANYYGDSVGMLSSAGNVTSGAGYNGGGIAHPQSVAIDGSGNVWVANYRGPSISQLAAASASNPGAALSPAAGWGPDAQLLEAYGIAIDAAGNVWVSNFGSNSLTEFVGLAVPVRTPLLGPVSTP